MPLPVALIAAGASLAGNAMSAGSNARQNRLNRQFSWDMYSRQRADALADYDMQNEYNSPAATMQRLKAGGLNPNLAYGSGATTTAAPVRSTNAPSYHGNPNQYDFSGVGAGLMMQYEAELKKVQTDNVKAATDVAKEEALLKSAQIANTLANTANLGVSTSQKQFDLGQAQNLSGYVLEAARANLKKTYTDIESTESSTAKTRADIGQVAAFTKFTLDQNERAAAMQAPTLQLAVQRVLSERLNQSQTKATTDKIRQEIENAKKSGALQQLDINLKSRNIQPHDPIYMRILAPIIGTPQEFKHNVDEAAKKILNKFKDIINSVSPTKIP